MFQAFGRNVSAAQSTPSVLAGYSLSPRKNIIASVNISGKGKVQLTHLDAEEAEDVTAGKPCGMDARLEADGAVNVVRQRLRLQHCKTVQLGPNSGESLLKI